MLILVMLYALYCLAVFIPDRGGGAPPARHQSQGWWVLAPLVPYLVMIVAGGDGAAPRPIRPRLVGVIALRHRLVAAGRARARAARLLCSSTGTPGPTNTARIPRAGRRSGLRLILAVRGRAVAARPRAALGRPPFRAPVAELVDALDSKSSSARSARSSRARGTNDQVARSQQRPAARASIGVAERPSHGMTADEPTKAAARRREPASSSRPRPPPIAATGCSPRWR